METGNSWKLEELRKNKDELFSKNIDDHITIGFELAIYYLEGSVQQNYFFTILKI